MHNKTPIPPNLNAVTVYTLEVIKYILLISINKYKGNYSVKNMLF